MNKYGCCIKFELDICYVLVFVNSVKIGWWKNILCLRNKVEKYYVFWVCETFLRKAFDFEMVYGIL